MTRYLAPLVLGIAGIAVLLTLGTWQVRRLAWKEDVLAQIEAIIAAPAVPLPATATEQDDKFRPVILTGTMTDDEIHVLVSRKQIGPGYRVISAFVADDGRRVLVDRGFIPLEAKDTPRPPQTLTVTGNLHWPDDLNSDTPAPDLTRDIWFARDIPAMAAALETEPLLIIARSNTGQGVDPLPVDTAGIPNDHLQYAITWFSLALVWLGMTLYWLWRIRAKATKTGI